MKFYIKKLGSLVGAQLQVAIKFLFLASFSRVFKWRRI